jgi:hypothetical protein
MSDFHLAQYNIGRMRFPADSPEMADFMNGLDPINALADSAPGFVWRYTTEGSNNATSDHPYGDEEIIVNLSVWETREQLWDFSYRSEHMDFLRRRREWFVRLGDPDQVLWWVPAGTTPTVAEAMERLELIREKGPTPEAFSFRKYFDPVAV